MGRAGVKNGGQLVVDALRCFSTERVFCVPGESYLPVLDALHDADIETIVCRQEGGAAMMAEATAKLTGKPGICLVTRGPGATNASAGVHIADQDATPVILLIGQISTRRRHREMFQEVDYQQFFGGMAKWVAEIDTTERIPEMMSRAWHVATSGRPGPVVLALPEDTLQQQSGVESNIAVQQTETYPGAMQLEQMQGLIEQSRQPLAIVGGSRWSEEASLQFTRFAERFGLPVACSFRRQMLFDHSHPNYAGDVGLGINPALKDAIKTTDLLLLVGCRFSEIPSQDFELLGVPYPTSKVVHVYPDSSEIGKLYVPTIAINASATAFCEAADKLQPECNHERAGVIEAAHQSYRQWSSLEHAIPSAATMQQAMMHLIEVLPPDSIICNGAGNYASWVHRFFPFTQYGTQLAPTSGSMGYGLPAAIAGKLAHPDKTVVAFAGDGCFQMTMQEFGTAVEFNAAVIVLVVDNGMYGTIRMHQEQNFPGRLSATNLQSPDFAALAESYGAFGATVENGGEFAEAFTAAVKCSVESNKPALIHIRTDPDALTPTLSLSSFQ